MANNKIQDRAEAIRWIEGGKTYAWIVEEYKRKYNIETAVSTWSMFRRREGIERRIVRHEDLVPWAVEREHRWAYQAIMLRAEGRRRAGKELPEKTLHELDTWLATLKANDAVVEYSPEFGFLYVPRLPSDEDIIRQPTKDQRRGRPAASDD